jgi:hypothetical protein
MLSLALWHARHQLPILADLFCTTTLPSHISPNSSKANPQRMSHSYIHQECIPYRAARYIFNTPSM